MHSPCCKGGHEIPVCPTDTGHDMEGFLQTLSNPFRSRFLPRYIRTPCQAKALSPSEFSMLEEMVASWSS